MKDGFVLHPSKCCILTSCYFIGGLDTDGGLFQLSTEPAVNIVLQQPDENRFYLDRNGNLELVRIITDPDDNRILQQADERNIFPQSDENRITPEVDENRITPQSGKHKTTPQSDENSEIALHEDTVSHNDSNFHEADLLKQARTEMLKVNPVKKKPDSELKVSRNHITKRRTAFSERSKTLGTFQSEAQFFAPN